MTLFYVYVLCYCFPCLCCVRQNASLFSVFIVFILSVNVIHKVNVKVHYFLFCVYMVFVLYMLHKSWDAV